MATVLKMVQDVLEETGFPKPSTLVGNNNQEARSALALVNRAAKRLAKEHQWTALTKEHEFTLVKNQASYELPDDFHAFVNQTMWDRVDSRPVEGVSPAVWQEFKSGLITAEIFKRWRVKTVDNAREIFIDPTPTATQCTFECRDGKKVKIGVAFEYISNYSVADTNNVAKETFTVDTDTFLLSDDLLELSFRWRWLSALGQAYQEEKFEFDRALSIAKAQDGNSPVIRMDSTSNRRYPNIPETGVGL